MDERNRYPPDLLHIVVLRRRRVTTSRPALTSIYVLGLNLAYYGVISPAHRNHYSHFKYKFNVAYGWSFVVIRGGWRTKVAELKSEATQATSVQIRHCSSLS